MPSHIIFKQWIHFLIISHIKISIFNIIFLSDHEILTKYYTSPYSYCSTDINYYLRIRLSKIFQTDRKIFNL